MVNGGREIGFRRCRKDLCCVLHFLSLKKKSNTTDLKQLRLNVKVRVVVVNVFCDFLHFSVVLKCFIKQECLVHTRPFLSDTVIVSVSGQGPRRTSPQTFLWR